MADLVTVTFNYTGSTQTWTVPGHKPGTLTIEVVGGAGGHFDAGNGVFTNRGGYGGWITGTLDISAGSVLTIGVGERGHDDPSASSPPGDGLGGGGPRPGGDGGQYGSHAVAGPWGIQAGGGGGGTEVLLGATVIAVAGGGGGGGRKSALNSGRRAPDGARQTGVGDEAYDGGQNAYTAPPSTNQGLCGQGGQLAAAGLGGASATNKAPTYLTAGFDGSAGAGGNGAEPIYVPGSPPSGSNVGGGGGGGGGYYGAGGGGGSAGTTFAGGGGGGSSWSNTTYVTEDAGTGPVAHVGDGYITFTYEPAVSLASCTTVTFTPGSAVPQGGDGAVVYSSGALDSFGTDDTPTGWPTSGKVTAIEVEVTSTDEFTADGQIQAVVCRPDTLGGPIPGATSDASGVWSGWDGGIGRYRTSGVDAYKLNKIGSWRTDYLTHSSIVATANTVSATPMPTTDTDIDIRFKVRLADWDGGFARTVCSGGLTGIPLIRFDTAGMFIRLDGSRTTTVDYTTLGVTDGQPRWFRVTWNNTDRLTVYTSTNGTSWTSVHTYAGTGYTRTSQSGYILRLGNGQNASGVSQAGLNGDMYEFELYSNGTLIQTLSLDAMATSTATSWTPAVGITFYRNGGVTVNGATIPATQRVRWEADTPYPVTDVRLIVDAYTGALTVDEILLEAECGVRFGVYRDGKLHAT